VVLFVPRTTVERKTARMFAALDGLPFDDGAVAARFAERPPLALDGTRIYNSFERVAFNVFDGLAGIWQALEDRTGEPVRLAGAGPTLFWIGAAGRASGIAERARGVDCDVIETATAESLWKP
jgi:4-diphosphocytidyl-2C-methyl-D-erythritol kinase